MPRTASTTTTERTAPRPSAKFREERVREQVPVLFRLPWVDCLPAPAIDSEPLFETPELPSNLEPAVVVAPPLPLKQEVAPPAEPVAPQVATAQVLASTEPEPQRSWWEHWSSGVVLILLIIALITASIIAFNDSGSSDPNLLAELDDKSPASTDLSIPELTSLQANASPSTTSPSIDSRLPQASLPSPQQPASNPASNEVASDRSLPKAQFQAASTSTPAVEALAETASSLIPGDLQFGEAESSSTSAPTSNNSLTIDVPAESLSMQSSVRPIASLVDSRTETASLSKPAEAALALPQTSTSEPTLPLAAAKLSPPVGIDPQPLFSSDNIPLDAGSTARSNTTADPARRTHTFENVSTPSAAALSPSLDDGALSLPDQPYGLQTQSSAGATHDTKLPSYQALLVGAVTSSTLDENPSDQSANSANQAEATANMPTATSIPNSMPATATPDFSMDVLIQKWKELHAINQAQSGQNNRYPTTPAGSGATSYTLGGATTATNPQQPVQTGFGAGQPASPNLPRY